ncbi:MAG: hypothetical protein QOD10_3739, partial [Mycobacterium sp.]|nr:hypothetical protein [Mycobacterium sp.]
MTSPTPIRTGIYLRQSLDKAGDELAIKRGLEDGIADCARRNWLVVEVFKDNDCSASNGKPRKDYLRMLTWIRDGKLDAVWTPHQDRLHRNVMEMLQFTEVAIRHNLKLATVSGEIDLSTDDGEFMATLGAALAHKEVRRKGAR